MPLPSSRQLLVERLRHPPAPACIATVVISIKHHYARLIEGGTKRVEFRRRFPKSFQTGQAIFYITSPTRAIALVARITAVHRATPAALWREFAAAGGAERKEFDAYFKGVAIGIALVLDRVRVLRVPLTLADPRLRAIDFRPPQSLAVLPANSPLSDIVAALDSD
jgi:predicted transcriptional regulator